MAGPSGVTYAYHAISSSPQQVRNHRFTYLRHPTVNNKIMTVDEAAFVAGKENHCMRLFNGLAESSGREVHLTTEPLRLIIAQPVLQERGAVIVSMIISQAQC